MITTTLSKTTITYLLNSMIKEEMRKKFAFLNTYYVLYYSLTEVFSNYVFVYKYVFKCLNLTNMSLQTSDDKLSKKLRRVLSTVLYCIILCYNYKYKMSECVQSPVHSRGQSGVAGWA